MAGSVLLIQKPEKWAAWSRITSSLHKTAWKGRLWNFISRGMIHKRICKKRCMMEKLIWFFMWCKIRMLPKTWAMIWQILSGSIIWRLQRLKRVLMKMLKIRLRYQEKTVIWSLMFPTIIHSGMWRNMLHGRMQRRLFIMEKQTAWLWTQASWNNIPMIINCTVFFWKSTVWCHLQSDVETACCCLSWIRL